MTIKNYVDQSLELEDAKSAARHVIKTVSSRAGNTILSNFIAVTFGGSVSDDATIRSLSDTAAELMVEGRLGYVNARERAGTLKETIKAEIAAMFEDFKSNTGKLFAD